jgi:hypothetical protein
MQYNEVKVLGECNFAIKNFEFPPLLLSLIHLTEALARPLLHSKQIKAARR